MMQQRRTALKELQKLDLRIVESRQKIQEFDPLFEEIEEPALILEGELGTSRNRLKEMQLEERRLELSTEERRERIRKLDERLGGVRNLREEAAVSAELEMVKRGLQNDEQEAFSLIDSVRKGEERVTELEAAYAEASALVEPQRDELLAKRKAAREELASFEREREAFVSSMDPAEMKIYDAIRGNGSRAAVAELTDDGACGNCFGVVPLQSQNEIRHGEALIRCEACGVIIAAPEPVAEPDEAAPDDESAAAGSDDAESVEGGDEDSDAVAEVEVAAASDEDSEEG